MRFLDHFIQPRKSYRNVSHLLQSPNHSQQILNDGAKDEPGIDRRIEQTLQISQIMQQFHNHMLPDAMVHGALTGGHGEHGSGHMSSENLSLFEQYNNFHQHQQNHQHQQQQQQHHQHQHHHQQQQLPQTSHQPPSLPHQQLLSGNAACIQNQGSIDPSALLASNTSSTTSEAAVPNADALFVPETIVGDNVVKNEISHTVESSSSSLISSLASPITGTSQHASDTFDESNRAQKRRRSSISITNNASAASSLSVSNNLHGNTGTKNHNSSTNHLSDDADDDDHESSSLGRLRSPPFPADFLYPFYQHATSHAQHQRQQQHAQQQAAPLAVRNSEQLLGELVTSELLKMSKERRKTAQKKILEVLFFDD